MDVPCTTNWTTWVSLLAPTISAAAAVVSALAARDTRRHAALDRLPMLGIQEVRCHCTVPDVGAAAAGGGAPPKLAIVALRLEVVLVNPGRVPVFYAMKSMHADCASRIAATPKFYSRSGVLMPGATMAYAHPVLLFDPPLNALPAEGHLRFEFSYRAHGEGASRKEYVLKESLGFAVDLISLQQSNFRWFYMDEDLASAHRVR